tara:strand:- start:184 stop:912 length:729 start_codon:yes stop_codon:yes gene_type:complete
MITDVKATWEIGSSTKVFDANFGEFTRLFDEVVKFTKNESGLPTWLPTRSELKAERDSVVSHRDRLLKKMRRQTKQITKLQAERDFFEGQFHATLDAQADAEDDWSDATDKLAQDNSDLIKELKKLKDLNVTKNNEIKDAELQVVGFKEERDQFETALHATLEGRQADIDDAVETHFADFNLRETTHKEWDILQDEIKDLQDEIGVYKDEQDEHIDELFDILDVDDIDDIVPAVKALKAKNE